MKFHFVLIMSFGLFNSSLCYCCILQVAQVIWVCENQCVHTWPVSIKDYKKELKTKVTK